MIKDNTVWCVFYYPGEEVDETPVLCAIFDSIEEAVRYIDGTQNPEEYYWESWQVNHAETKEN